MALTNEDRDRIADAIARVETRTSGQIVCVVARASSNYAYMPLVWAALLALAAPWPLIGLTHLSVQRIYIIQLVMFIAAAVLFEQPWVRFRIVPRPVRRARAFRAATEQFLIRGLTRTRERTGVLIYVSLAERYARIIADDGIAAKVKQADWQGAVDVLVQHISANEIADGLVAAVEQCGLVLAAHAPPISGPTSELPNRVYVL